ncbi:MAG: hypothetical protein IAE62_01200 [Flavobacteriales bacterium]|nr:hypothetical protein [Flavobacteriales bacterium]
MINTQTLSTLSQKIQDGTATKAEKDNYMWILYQNGHITKKQYDEYTSEKNSNEVLNAGLTIGAIVLLGALIRKIATT